MTVLYSIGVAVDWTDTCSCEWYCKARRVKATASTAVPVGRRIHGSVRQVSDRLVVRKRTNWH